MLLLKCFSHEKSRARYRSYLRAHAILGALTFLFLLLGLLLGSAFCLTSEGIDASEYFRLHWQARCEGGWVSFALFGFSAHLVPFLCSLVFGITVYAPLAAGLCAITHTFTVGVYLRFLLGTLTRQAQVGGFFVFLPFALCTLWILCITHAFSCAVSLRTFSPRTDGAESERMFGGTLFCAPYFENSINLRFLSSYLLCFFALALALFLCCLAQGALVCLL